ncbi:MAG: YggT family protein [Pseudomonadota bacterium]
MNDLVQIANLLLDVAFFFIFAHFIMSWLIAFNVLNVRQQLVAQIWYALQRLLEPIYGPIRRVLPQLGGLDLAPLVAIIGIQIIRILIN